LEVGKVGGVFLWRNGFEKEWLCDKGGLGDNGAEVNGTGTKINVANAVTDGKAEDVVGQRKSVMIKEFAGEMN
jgi:hypothetical protein